MKHVIPTLAIALVAVLLGGPGPAWARDKLDRHAADNGRHNAGAYYKVGRGQELADHRQFQTYAHDDDRDGKSNKHQKRQRTHKKKHKHNTYAHTKRHHDRRNDRHANRDDRWHRKHVRAHDQRHNDFVVRNGRRYDTRGYDARGHDARRYDTWRYDTWYDRVRAARRFNELHGNSSWGRPWTIYRHD